jgi:hypothetical protein
VPAQQYIDCGYAIVGRAYPQLLTCGVVWCGVVWCGVVWCVTRPQQFVMSAGMDGLIKAWQVADTPAVGMAVHTTPEYVFDRDGDGSDAPAGGGNRYRRVS